MALLCRVSLNAVYQSLGLFAASSGTSVTWDRTRGTDAKPVDFANAWKLEWL